MYLTGIRNSSEMPITTGDCASLSAVFSALSFSDSAGRSRSTSSPMAAGLRDQVKILVGGAPVTQKFADQIGADGYGENAPLAVALAKRLLGVGV